MKGRKFPAEVLDRSEVRRLIEASYGLTPMGLRNRALLTVLYRAGLRISEALDLCPKDLDPVAGTVRVLHGKGDKARTVGMDADSFREVAKWMKVRRKYTTDDAAPLFCTRKGGRIGPSYIRGLLPRLAREAGITKRVHAHGLRHTHAYTLACEGVPIHYIQRQLGHSNVAITSLYINHLSPGEVVRAVRSVKWA